MNTFIICIIIASIYIICYYINNIDTNDTLYNKRIK